MVTELRRGNLFWIKWTISLYSVVSFVLLVKLWLHPVHNDHAEEGFARKSGPRISPYEHISKACKSSPDSFFVVSATQIAFRTMRHKFFKS
jgi:hypothetical protein